MPSSTRASSLLPAQSQATVMCRSQEVWYISNCPGRMKCISSTAPCLLRFLGKAPACAEGAEAAPPAIHSTGFPFCQHASSVAGHMVSALFTYYLVYSQSFQTHERFNSLKLPHQSVQVYMQCIFSPFNVFKNF